MNNEMTRSIVRIIFSLGTRTIYNKVLITCICTTSLSATAEPTLYYELREGFSTSAYSKDFIYECLVVYFHSPSTTSSAVIAFITSMTEVSETGLLMNSPIWLGF